MARGRQLSWTVPAIPAAVLYFFAVCLISAATGKMAAMLLSVLTLSAAFLFFARLRDRIGVPLLLLAAFVLMGGISTFYAVSGKFALYEFLKLLSSLCLVLLLLALAPGEGARPGQWIAAVLSGCSALAGLVSIDLLSTRIFSGAVLKVLAQFTPDYGELSGVEAGIRMTSLFSNPNVFAGVAGLGVLLSLGLVGCSERDGEWTAHTVVLYINALAFLLAFSMGASGAIALSFLALLFLERKQRRAGLLVLMLETLLCSVAAAAVISVTAFQAWEGVQPVPLACVILGAAALCLLDRFAGRPLAARMGGGGRLVPILTAAALVCLVLFGVTAYRWTGDITLGAGGVLRRAAYPEPGRYTLDVSAEGSLAVTIESQNQRETMMHTSTVLYEGEAAQAGFTVPEDSLVVYFNFTAPEGAHVQAVSYGGEADTGSVPLGYKLLPGFIANRLQGLWANENAIQRLVFFSDGWKLFLRSPVIGLGLGAFENGVKSVQSFYYETKYAHNHYIQTLTELGVVGLVLFLAVLAGGAAAVLLERRRGGDAHPLTASLGAALVFMAAHAATEVVFSAYAYLPMAFGVFALISLCCGDALPRVQLTQKVKSVSLLVCCGFIGIYAVLVGCNLRAQQMVQGEITLDTVAKAADLDKFEWADHALSYVISVEQMEADGSIEVDAATRGRADVFAQRLSRLDSNTVPIYLAEYYFRNGRTEEGLAMIEKYVSYVSSDPVGWEQAFAMLEQYEQDTQLYRAGVLRTAQLLEEWNEANMGEISLNEQALAFIERMGGA